MVYNTNKMLTPKPSAHEPDSVPPAFSHSALQMKVNQIFRLHHDGRKLTNNVLKLAKCFSSI